MSWRERERDPFLLLLPLNETKVPREGSSRAVVCIFVIPIISSVCAGTMLGTEGKMETGFLFCVYDEKLSHQRSTLT